ncbi:MAG TPA: N-acetyltransferase [Actinomycetota bacterium]|nr:N-acetyltransferase [Actinomycetota bacterium]
MGIRLETHWDHDPIRRLLTAAFGRVAEAKLVDALRQSDAYVPQLALVAENSTVVLGHILFSRVTLESQPPAKVLALAPVAVFPAFQRRGVGSALIREGLARADRMGEPLVVVLGHPEYYPRFGFVPASSLGITPPWPDIPDEAFMVKPLSGYREDMRGVVRYPPEFDQV